MNALNQTIADLRCEENKDIKILENKIIVIAIIPFSFLLNSFNLIVFFFIIKKRTFSNLLYTSTSANDFIASIFTMPIEIITYLLCPGNGLNYEVLVIIDYILSFCTNTVSIYNLVIMSFHRYFQLKYPLKSNERMSLTKYLILSLNWVINYLFWISSYVYQYFYFYDRTDFSIYNLNFMLMIDVLFYAGPLLIIIILNILVFIEIKKRNKIKQMNGLKNKALILNRKDKEYKAYLYLLLFSFIMLLCFSLYSFSIFLSPFVEINDRFYYAASNITYFINLANPILLLTFQDEFKNEFIKFIGYLKKKLFFRYTLCNFFSLNKYFK